ncbi:MAG: DNA polymerase III subunit delta [Gemmatimonadota bacterium]|nr:DNA polymerase III subunit delta [Gemmatimonadota bacterium]
MLPKSLRDAEPQGVYFLYGDEEFRKEAAVRGLVERALDPATRDFNFDQLNGTDVTPEHLASVIATPPMMAPRRVVLVRQAEGLTASATLRKIVLECAAATPPGLVLVLQATVPARSKARFYTDLRKAATAVEFKAVGPDEAPSWLVAWARDELGVDVNLDAARALASAVGCELGLLTNEVRKLATMVGAGNPVTKAAVERGGLVLPRQDRWAWFDAVGSRDLAAALDGLPVLLAHGESPVGLTIGLGTHLLRLGVGIEGGSGALERALPPYQRFLARRLTGQAKRWSKDELADAVRGLERLDRLLKASSLPGALLMEEWLLAHVSRRQERGRGVA